MSRVKNQHYVPQTYLERFANDRGQLWVFDKVTRRSYASHMRNVATETSFYDFGDEVMKTLEEMLSQVPERELPAAEKRRLLDPQFVEHELSKMESDFAAALCEVLQTVDTTGGFTQDQKETMAYFLTRQMLRVPEFRHTHIERMNKVVAEMSRVLVATEFGVAALEHAPEVSLDERYVAYEHARMMFDPEVIQTYMDVLLGHIWHVGVSDADRPLYTSDNPVIMRSHINEPAFGFGSYGVEIMFPLSPRHVLILNERRYFKAIEGIDCKVTHLVPDNVLYYNSGQVLRSRRHVYSSVSRFELAVDVCATYPEVCIPDRERIRVVGGVSTWLKEHRLSGHDQQQRRAGGGGV